MTTIVTTAVAPFARGPGAQATTPRDSRHRPWLAVAETSWTFPGSVSTVTTSFAVLGPLFLTVMVYVKRLPSVTGSGESVCVTARSAFVPAGLTVTVKLQVDLFPAASVAVTSTVVVPIGKSVPDGCEYVITGATSTASLATAAG